MFSEKQNLAKEFKKAYESGNKDELNNILIKWLFADSKDANLQLASVIFFVLTDSASEEEMMKTYVKASSLKPSDPELHTWFNETALKEMSKVVKNSSVGGHDSSVDEEDDFDITDNFAKEFISTMEGMADPNADFAKENQKLDKILKAWGKKYPEDANYTCAYIMVHCIHLSESEIRDLVFKANTQKPVDESCYDTLMNGVSTAVGFLDKRSESGLKNNKFKNLKCSEFSEKMLEIHGSISNASEDELGEILADINMLMPAWEIKCPDDANLTCAKIVYMINKLPESEIKDLQEKLKTQEPANKELHGRFLAMADAALNFMGYK